MCHSLGNEKTNKRHQVNKKKSLKRKKFQKSKLAITASLTFVDKIQIKSYFCNHFLKHLN